MNRNRMRALLVLGASVAMLGPAGGAGAASTVTSGWWTSAPVALGPDVDEGQLLVQGGPSAEDPLAYAGISFALEEGEVPEALVLVVAPESGTTPGSTLSLCALDAPATPAAGEPAEGAPAPDCATEVEAEPAADGTSYEFDVRAFGAVGSLDLAVVPGQQTDRVVLEAPTTTSLTGEVGSPSRGGGDRGSTTPPTPRSSGGLAGAGGAAGAGSGGAPVSPPFRSPRVTVPPSAAGTSAGPSPADAADEQASAPLQPPAPFHGVPAASQDASDGGGIPAALVFAGLAATAAALWTVAGNQRDERPLGEEVAAAVP